MDYDLTVFDEKMPWQERYKVIKKTFPSVETLDWNKVFRSDPAIMGRIVNDVLKIDQAEPGRPGKRPALDIERAESRLRQIRGEDYTVLPFVEALEHARGDKSIRSLSYYSGLPKSTVHRLAEGLAHPTVEQLEAIAKGVRKDPSYFMEYRVAFVLTAMAELFSRSPESTVVQYEKLREAMK
jgi:transcriptional regulator with XRE-family HTH domain